MARYIDADAVIKEIEAAQDSLKSNNDAMWGINKKYYKGLCMAHRIVDEQPTADVVPRSEVDKTIAEWAYLHADTLNKLENSKADVAREIFEEIEKIFNKRIAFYTDMAKQSKFTEKHYAETMINNCGIYLQEIAELKKKYTNN